MKKNNNMTEDIIAFIEKLDFDKDFIVDDINNKKYTYNEFFEKAIVLAKYIEDNVLADCIIAVKENSLDLAMIYFAVMLTKKSIYVADPKKGEGELLEILENIEHTSIFIDDNISLAEQINHDRLVFPDFDNMSADILNKKFYIIDKIKQRSGDMPYLVTFTSGTSGKTKGVEHSLLNLLSSAVALAIKVKKTGGTFIHVMPMTYMAGILNSLFYPFIIGSKIIITRRFSIMLARSFWGIVIKYDVDLFWLSPSMLMMIDKMDRGGKGEEYCKSSNMTFLVGTAPLTTEMRNKINERYGVKVFASYGLSETLFVSVETNESLIRSRADSVGELLPGVEYNFSKTGEININVPWMYLRYTNEEIAPYFEYNFYKTGDLAELEDDCLYIVGRSKDLIIKGGMNISPLLIEKVVRKNQFVFEAVVLGVKDGDGEEKICCVYCQKDNVDVPLNELETEIKKMVINELGMNYALDYLWKVDDIPKNVNGKIDKIELRKMWVKRNE